MGMRLITGNTLDTKVQAEDDRALNAGIIKKQECVFSVGSKFEHEILSANTIRIKEGDGVMFGAHFRIPKGEFEEVKIETCPVGFKRIDIICAKYKKYQNTESCSIEVVKGVQKNRDPVVPIIKKGNILNGDAENLMPLKIVTLDGVNISAVENAFVLNDDLNILWEGAFYMMPTEEQTINLSEENAISKQNNGVIFAFCAFDRNILKPKDTEWMYFFVPKSHVMLTKNAGTATTGIYMSDAYAGLYKYLYVEDRKIRGFSSNSEAGTVNGIAYRNNDFVLRYVIGV